MSWTSVRYVCAIALVLWSLQGVRMVFVYLGVARSAIGVGPNLPFATRSLAWSVNSAVYSAILFLFCRGVTVAVAVVVFWVVRRMVRASLRRLWFRYLAHLFVAMRRRSDPSAVQETSGPIFQEALDMAYRVIESAHAPASPFGKTREEGHS
jgi:hypothetical protein